MRCKIADLIADIPAVGDLVTRCQDYRWSGNDSVDVTIHTDRFAKNPYDYLTDNEWIYLHSGAHFYSQLLAFDGMMFHASAVELNNRAYLFSAPSGTGKSTHTRLWQSVFGQNAHIFNDDKPALRLIDGTWYAYGTPWCGKDSININMKASIAGICFLKQAPENRIRRLSVSEAVQRVFSQTPHKFRRVEQLDLVLSHTDKLVRQIPVFELENRPEAEAARLSYETMRRAAEELGL